MSVILFITHDKTNPLMREFVFLQSLIKGMSKELGRKGKRIFMPLRVALTVR